MCTPVVSPVKRAETKTSHSSLSMYLSIERILKKRTFSIDEQVLNPDAMRNATDLVADPEFSRGGHQPQMEGCQPFSRPNMKNMKKIGFKGGAHPKSVHVDPPLRFQIIIQVHFGQTIPVTSRKKKGILSCFAI